MSRFGRSRFRSAAFMDDFADRYVGAWPARTVDFASEAFDAVRCGRIRMR